MFTTVLHTALIAPSAIASDSKSEGTSTLDCACLNAKTTKNSQQLREQQLATEYQLILNDFDAESAYHDMSDNNDVSIRINDKVMFQHLSHVYLTKNLDIIAKQNDKSGVIDKTGKVIIPFEYDSIYTYQDAFVVKKDKLFGFINRQHQALTSDEYYFDNCKLKLIQRASAYQPLIGYKKTGAYTGKWGALDSEGQVVIPFDYDSIGEVTDNYSIASGKFYKVKKDDYWGIIDSKGNTILPPHYQRIRWFNTSQNLFYVIKNNQKFVVDASQNIIIDGNIGSIQFIDADGEESYSVYDDEVHDGSVRPAIIEIDGKYGLFDSSGRQLLPARYEAMQNLYSLGLLQVEKDGKQGVIDLKGSTVIPAKFDELDPVNINIKGEDLSHLRYFIAKQNGKFGLLSIDNTQVLPFEYDSMTYNVFTLPNRLIVSKPINNDDQIKFALLNVDGTPLTPFIYDKLEYDNYDSRLHVWIKDLNSVLKEGLIDNNGNVLLAPKYDRLHFEIVEDGYVFEQGGKYGWITEDSFNEIIPATFDERFDFEDGIAKVIREGKTFWIDRQGREVNKIPQTNE
ncbi:WG repeat-containing protein [Psychrobacter sp. FDAARGOS_221]|uniref:WG repeat-containing protein n=1 Tax=Psychrobacter sp. FDAARGOS_221 TaxID=1975705 RepID=UPI00187D45A3|nr:WG repeat-containing protein [Psychrobacter sp. FDAARGOS_221]